jgi:hypothetical protein
MAGEGPRRIAPKHERAAQLPAPQGGLKKEQKYPESSLVQNWATVDFPFGDPIAGRITSGLGALLF